MRSQDEEYSKAVAEPGEGVQEVDPSTHQHNFLELKKGWAQEILELGEGVNCEGNGFFYISAELYRTSKRIGSRYLRAR